MSDLYLLDRDAWEKAGSPDVEWLVPVEPVGKITLTDSFHLLDGSVVPGKEYLLVEAGR